MNKEEKNNVIPFIKEKQTRDIVKKEFDFKPGNKSKQAAHQESLDRINTMMSELKETVRKQNEYLTETGSHLLNKYAAERMKEEPRYGDKSENETGQQSTLDQAALAAEYQRKKNAAKKYQEENNRKVTREYGLLGRGKPGSSRDDKKPR